MIYRFLTILSLVVILASNAFADYNHLKNHKYLLLIDKDTKEILLEKNSHTRVAPSSMTKLMTAYVVFDQIKKGNIKLNSRCLIGKDAWRKRGSSMFLNYGDIVSINKLLKGLLTVSGNDSAVALAKSAGKDYNHFIALMNIKAKELGMDNSKFQNPHGLNQNGHYMSLHDLATLLSRIYDDFPEFVPYLGIKKFTYANITQYNRNPLIRTKYKGFIGGKTGHTNDGGYGIAASVTRGNRTLIGVVNKAKSSTQRVKIITELFDYGFEKYRKIELFKKNQHVTHLPTWIGEKDSISVSTNKDVAFNIPSDFDIKNIKVSVNYDGPVQTPISDGTKVANLKVSIGKYETMTYSLFSDQDVKKASFFSVISRKVQFLSQKIYRKIRNKIKKLAIYENKQQKQRVIIAKNQ
tara:strand:- start:88 stop:1311 length:1224 start_codon:yes stop_codon:yes gene_type:complete